MFELQFVFEFQFLKMCHLHFSARLFPFYSVRDSWHIYFYRVTFYCKITTKTKHYFSTMEWEYPRESVKGNNNNYNNIYYHYNYSNSKCCGKCNPTLEKPNLKKKTSTAVLCVILSCVACKMVQTVHRVKGTFKYLPTVLRV